MTAVPCISVVIPCYNSGRFIAETLRSVAAQKDVDLEVVVVDDGSTDDSREVIESFRSTFGERLRTRYGANRGASAARNTGTEMARGAFIQYLDADDLLLPATLANRVHALAKGGDVAYCGWQELEEDSGGVFQHGKTFLTRLEDVHPRTEIALFRGFWCPPAAMLYRRSIVDAVAGWNERLPVIQDARFALDAALKGAVFRNIPELGALYRVTRGGLSRRDPVAFLLDCLTNAQEIEQHWRAGDELDSERRQALAAIYGYAAYGLIGKNEGGFYRSLEGRARNRFPLDYSKAELFSFAVRCLGYERSVRVLEYVRTRRKAARSAAAHPS